MPAETARIEDHNGWFEVKRQPISKAGVFDYLGSKLTEAPDPDAIYRVYRPETELSDPAFLDSVKLIPWIDDHEMLGPEEFDVTPAEQKGVGGTTGEQVEYADGTVYSNIKCYSEAQRTSIENGKVDISLGYRCKYLWKSGEWNGQKYDVIQCQLRGNHLASVEEGRMGAEVAVLDHNDITGTKPMDEIKKLLAALLAAFEKIEGAAAEVPAVVATEDEDEAAKPAATAADEDEAAKPAATAADEDEAAKPAATAMDEADVGRLLAHAGRRDKLAAELKKYTGSFDHSAMTETKLAAYGVKKLGITCKPGTELSAIAGYLAGRKAAPEGVARKPAGTGMDSVSGAPTFVTKQIAERNKG